VHVGGHPVEQLLGAGGLGVDEARGPHGGDEELRSERDGQPAGLVDGDLHPGEVDEELLPGLVGLAHGDIEVTPPAVVVVAELGVAVAVVGVGPAVLVPEEHEGHARAPVLPVDPLEVREGPLGGPLAGSRGEQQGLQGVVVEVVGKRPAEPRRLRPPEVVGDRGVGDGRRQADLAKAELVLAKAQAEDISNPAHGDMGTGHR
jgi:hypothetical protein